MKNLAKLLCISFLLSGAASVACDLSSTCGSTCSTSCSDCGDCNDCCQIRSIYIPRSAGLNLATQMYRNFTYYDRCECDDCCFYGDLNLKLEFQKSFKDERIAKSLFGNCYMNFVGSKVTGTRAADAIMADNFGLSPETNAKLYFSPRIKTFTADVQLFLGLDDWANGLYFKLDVPISHADWDLRLGCSDCCDCNDCCSTNGCSSNGCTTTCSTPAVGTAAFGAGVMDAWGSTSEGTTVAAATSFAQALGGDFKFGDMQTSWKYGRFGSCDDSETKVANLFFDLGYNFWMCEDYHMGIFLRVGAPTGTNIDACYARNVFNPIVGEDHWMLGGGISAHSELWRSCDEDKSFNVFFEGYIAHMFKRDQIRTFDFKTGALTRYLLLKEFAKNDAGDYEYNDNMINAVNWTTRCVEVDVNVVGEAAIDFTYQHCNWAAGLGYNIYGRSSEDIDCVKGFADSSVANKKYGIKGCTPIESPLYLVTDADGALAQVATPSARHTNNTTESKATMFACTSVANIDNANELYNAFVAPSTNGAVYVDQTRTDITSISKYSDAVATRESATGTPVINGTTGAVTGLTPKPVLLTDSDLDLCSAANPSYISHKIFGHVDYTWRDCDWAPYLQLGASGEFGSSDDCNVLNQWGIWLKGGLTY